jgi:putative flippase GtrA
MSSTPLPDRLLVRGVAFSLVGVINTLVGVAVIVFAGLAGAGPLLANVFGYTAGLLVSFTLNARVTFRQRVVDRGTLARFLIAFAVAFVVNLGVVAVAARTVGAGSIVGSLAGVPFYTVLFYLLCEYWVFARQAPGAPPHSGASATDSDHLRAAYAGSGTAMAGSGASGVGSIWARWSRSVVDGRPIPQPWASPLFGMLVFAVVVFAFLVASGQLAAPYLAHDDLDFLMPRGWTGGYATPWSNTLAEGRWLNYVWYQVSMHLRPQAAYALFIGAYFLLTCAFALHASKPRAFLACALAVFFSPAFGHLSLWPSALFCGVFTCAAATWLLLRVDGRYAPLVLFAATLVLVLAYPPCAALVLLAAALKTAKSSWRYKLVLGATYVFGFACGTLLIYLLNLGFHGIFGLQIAPWRHPRSGTSVAALLDNAGLYMDYWLRVAHAYWPAIVGGGVAAVALLLGADSRERALAVLYAVALICAIELGIVLVTGIAVPERATVWLWFAACALCAMLAARPGRFDRRAGVILLLGLALTGAGMWWRLYAAGQPTVHYEAALAKAIRAHPAASDGRDVIIVGNPRHVPALRALDETAPIPEFRMDMYQHGIETRQCSMAFCAQVRRYAQSHVVTRLMVVNGELALVFDPNGDADAIERDYPSVAQEAALKLGYPLFLRYGQSSVRITPLFPGTGSRAVSVRLAGGGPGYTLEAQGTSCAFPIAYTVVSETGEKLDAGQYRGTAPVTLQPWDTSAGNAILSVAMAAGATNNYGCNLVVTRQRGP